MAAPSRSRRMSGRKRRQPYGTPKPKPAKPKAVHSFHTGHAQWSLQYDRHGRLERIDRSE
jgi:YD repeat-containing protein